MGCGTREEWDVRQIRGGIRPSKTRLRLADGKRRVHHKGTKTRSREDAVQPRKPLFLPAKHAKEREKDTGEFWPQMKADRRR